MSAVRELRIWWDLLGPWGRRPLRVGAWCLAAAALVFLCAAQCQTSDGPKPPYQPPPTPATGGTAGAAGSAGQGPVAATGGNPGTFECPFEELLRASGVRERRAVVSRIVGGARIRVEALASLQDGTGWHRCGATWITEHVAVTARHCWPEPGDVLVASCQDLTSEDCTEHHVTRAISPPGWDADTLDWDAALVLTDRPFGGVPMPLAAAVDMSAPATTAGWGRTSEGGPVSSVSLGVDLPLLPWGECQALYPTLTSRMLCAVEQGEGSCQGDSGGPLMQRAVDGTWVLTGDVSHGYGCARGSGVYGSVPAMLEWIVPCAAMLEDGA